ncbi:pantoate--beta-alanine ligase [Aureibacillus halotolerans]|uniref:Pantothenate synthetase n=1 Tax=Aureibacillus halotolerans TaxID=1508390 RepID=A0A4R6U5K2_9BACI|nr:pantoate--beta-alanine ligase [Aureibacillus halotolerans]TDQ41501.1 pantothenate synthetase [Aureibacillus halotolerans]
MNQIRHAIDMQRWATQQRSDGKTIGFVPTMGFLHEGHAALLKQARLENDLVVLSIFVNPTQFGPNEDFETYPRSLETDLDVAKRHGVDVVFTPAASEMYPQRDLLASMSAGEAATKLCGASRPGHFDGVLIVVLKLFQLTQPNRAYFGRKDAQQVAVVKGMVKEYFLPIEIRTVATVREEDGLAKSSRNSRLTEGERQEASILYKSLSVVETLIKNAGDSTSSEAIENKWQAFLEENLSLGKVDYATLYSFPDLQPVKDLSAPWIAAVAVQFPSARLIDNVVKEGGEE